MVSLFFNKQRWRVSTEHLPMLIHGQEGSGASKCAIQIVADLYDQGWNIIFLCGYQMARDEFQQQVQAPHSSVTLTGGEQSNVWAGKRVVFLNTDQPAVINNALNNVETHKWLVFFKNYELFDEQVFSSVMTMPHCILAGDLDQCRYADRIQRQSWPARLYFSQPHSRWNVQLPTLEKYQGHLVSNSASGSISVKLDV